MATPNTGTTALKSVPFATEIPTVTKTGDCATMQMTDMTINMCGTVLKGPSNESTITFDDCSVAIPNLNVGDGRLTVDAVCGVITVGTCDTTVSFPSMYDATMAAGVEILSIGKGVMFATDRGRASVTSCGSGLVVKTCALYVQSPCTQASVEFDSQRSTLDIKNAPLTVPCGITTDSLTAGTITTGSLTAGTIATCVSSSDCAHITNLTVDNAVTMSSQCVTISANVVTCGCLYVGGALEFGVAPKHLSPVCAVTFTDSSGSFGSTKTLTLENVTKLLALIGE